MLLSQISCHTFLCFYQPRKMLNWPMETQNIHKELGLFYAVLLTVLLYIRWDQCIFFQVTLTTPSHQIFLKLYVGFQKVPSEPIKNCDFVDPQDQSWTSH